MKKLILVAALSTFAFFAEAQVVTVKGSKVDVRDDNGKFISSGNYSGLYDAIAGNGIVVLWFENGKVDVRDEKLKFISSGNYSNLKSVRTSGRNVVLQFTSGKTDVRDEKLKFVSSRN